MSESINHQENDFLTRFYESPETDYDNVAKKVVIALLPEKQADRIFREKAGEESDVSDDFFAEDTLQWKEREKRELSKRTKVSLFLLLVMIPLTVLIGMYFFRNAHYGADQNKIGRASCRERV